MTDNISILVDIDVKGDAKLGKVDKNLGSLGSTSKKAGVNLAGLTAKAGVLAAGLATAGVAAKATFDQISAGADLAKARQEFDNLSASINTTSESLLNNLRAATKGMISDAELIAGASDIINLGLGKTEGEVVRLTNAVGTLGLDMQQVILTFANNSTARLDALGLSIEDVTTKAQELEENGFQGDAFDEAVLIGLEDKMKLLGDASETTAGDIQVVTAAWQNFTDGAKQGAAGLLAPVISDLADTATVSQRAKLALDEGVISYREWVAVTNAADKAAANTFIDEKYAEVEANAAAAKEANVELTASFNSVSEAMAKGAGIQTFHSDTIEEFNEKRLEQLRLTVEQQAAERDLTGAVTIATEAMQKGAGIQTFHAEAAEEFATKQHEAAEAARQLEEAQAAQLATSGDLFTKYAEADGEFDLASTLYEQADAAGADAAALGLLGLASGKLTEDQAEAAIKQAALTAQLGKLSEAYASGDISLGSYLEQANNAVTDINNLTFTFDEQAGVVLSDAEAVNQLVGSMAAIPESVQSRIDIQHNIDEALGKLGSLQALAAGTGVDAADIHVKDGTGGVHAAAAMGADFIVPPGFPNDSFRLGVQTGEHVQVTPANQVGRGGNGGAGIVINQNISMPAANPYLLAQQGKMALMSELGGLN